VTAGGPPGEPLRYGRDRLLWVAVALFVLSGAVGTAVLWWGRGGAASAPPAGASGVVGVLATGVVTIAVTVVAHEAVHAAVATALGYRVRVGITRDRSAFYTVAPDQYWTRPHLAIAAIAPLVGIDGVALALVAVGPPWVAVPAVLALVTNTVGAAVDLLVVEQVVGSPPGTRFYDGVDGDTYRVMPGD